MAISGPTALIGAPAQATGPGRAYLFVQPESTWPLQAELAASDTTPGNNFGDSVALFGSEAVVGASLAAPAGTAYVFGNL